MNMAFLFWKWLAVEKSGSNFARGAVKNYQEPEWFEWNCLRRGPAVDNPIPADFPYLLPLAAPILPKPKRFQKPSSGENQVKKWIGLLISVLLGFSRIVYGENIGVVTTLAGSAGVTGFKDGNGTIASFDFPQGVAVDAAGNVYVADPWNNLIRKINPKGGVTTLAGSAGVTGATNATGKAASFSFPNSVAVDTSGNVYVTDSSNNIIRKINSKGLVTTLAGSKTKGAKNGKAKTAMFNDPTGIAVDHSGNLYIADMNNHLIRKISKEGMVTTLAGSAGVSGATNATGTKASFRYPTGVAVDSSENVYVADLYNNMIRKISPEGVVTTLAGSVSSGSNDGTGSQAKFKWPYGVAVDSSGNVYVADRYNNEIREITPGGEVSTLAGGGAAKSADGTGSAAGFNDPMGIAVDKDENIYVAEMALVRKMKLIPALANNQAQAPPASTGAGVASTSAGYGNAPANSSAPAGPITLVCAPATGKGDPAQMILNESAGTADFGSDAVTTATFNETTVWWEVDSQDPNFQIYYQKYYTLSRLTGVLTLSTSRGVVDSDGNIKWAREQGLLYNCKVGVEKRLF